MKQVQTKLKPSSNALALSARAVMSEVKTGSNKACCPAYFSLHWRALAWHSPVVRDSLLMRANVKRSAQAAMLRVLARCRATRGTRPFSAPPWLVCVRRWSMIPWIAPGHRSGLTKSSRSHKKCTTALSTR